MAPSIPDNQSIALLEPPLVVPAPSPKSSQVSLVKRHQTFAKLEAGSRQLWIFEIGSAVVSLLALIATGVILLHEDGKPLTAWTFSLSLNTIISILGTVSRAFLAYSISSCIGQSKWNWFRRQEDRLITFDRFDEASRGPVGSMKLIFGLRSFHWIIIGAAVTILSLGFEPFLQAIVSYSGKMGDLDSIHSSIGRCMRLDVGTYTSDGDLLISQEFSPQHMVDTLPEFSSSPDFGICATVYDGFSNSTPTKSQQVSFSCTTGNCTWPLFGSLAVCSSCNDVSSHVTRSRGNGVWNSTITAANQDITQVQAGNFTCFELPYLNICNYDGYTSSYMSANMTANRTAQTQQTVSFQNSTSSIVTFGFLQAAGSYFANSTAWEETPIIATECNLHFCVNIYESMVESGVIAERIVGSWSERAPDSWGSTTLSPQDVQSWNQRINSTLAPGFDITRTDLQMVIPKDEAAQIPQLPPNTALSFNVSQAAIVSTTLWIVGEFKGSAGLSGSVDELAYPLIGDQATMQPAISTVLAQSGNLSAMFDSVALSMSTWMRDISIDRTPQLGTTSQWVIYVRVRWWYFLLPAAVLVFGCIFTILSIIESYRLHVPPWKAGSLPILAHGLTPDVCERLRDADGMGQINDEAHEIKVRLRNMGSGLGLQVQH